MATIKITNTDEGLLVERVGENNGNNDNDNENENEGRSDTRESVSTGGNSGKDETLQPTEEAEGATENGSDGD